MKLQVHAHAIVVGLIFVKMIGVTSIMTECIHESIDWEPYPPKCRDCYKIFVYFGGIGHLAVDEDDED